MDAKVYEYKNATVYVHGEVDKERLKKATIQFLKKTYDYRKENHHDKQRGNQGVN